MVLPLEAGTGHVPHSFAKAASERMRSGLSPTRISISAAVPVAMPWAAFRPGAHASVSASSARSCSVISASSASQHRARARNAVLVEVALALLVAQLAVGAVHLDDGVPAPHQRAREASAIGAGALDAEGIDSAEGAGPGFQLAVAVRVHQDGDRAESGSKAVKSDG